MLLNKDGEKRMYAKKCFPYEETLEIIESCRENQCEVSFRIFDKGIHIESYGYLTAFSVNTFHPNDPFTLTPLDMHKFIKSNESFADLIANYTSVKLLLFTEDVDYDLKVFLDRIPVRAKEKMLLRFLKEKEEVRKNLYENELLNQMG